MRGRSEGRGALTLSEALGGLRRSFARAGLPTPDLDARILTLAALGLGAAELALRPERPLSDPEEETVATYGMRRLGGEPVARILGEWEFWGLPFDLSAETLVPRPETETVVEASLKLCPEPEAALRLADLGTGSGCILVALLTERRRASGIGVDRSAGALATARRNAFRNGVGPRSFFAGSHWAEALAGPFDLVVSNPPYVASTIIPTLEPEVRDHDPRMALDGGADGLDAYRAILADGPRVLAAGGHLVLEIDSDQKDAISLLLDGLPLEIREVAADLSGKPRCLVLQRS